MKKFLIIIILLNAVNMEKLHAQMFWNNAASFSGATNSYVAIPNSIPVSITGSFTIECWINPSTVTQAQGLVWKQGNPTLSYMFSIYSTGTLYLGTNSNARLYSKTKLKANQWTHVAATYNSATSLYSMYINGALDTTSTVPGSAPVASNDSLFLGRALNGLRYSGLMDNVRIWNKALSGNDILTNMRTILGVPAQGQFSNLMLSLPFQGRNSVGNPFTMFDWSYWDANVINRGVTQVNYTNKSSVTDSYNESLELDGNGDRVTVRPTAETDMTGAFSLEAWVYVRGLSNFHQTIVKRKTGLAGSGFNMVINSSNLFVVSVNGTGAGSPGQFPLKRWVHVAFTLSPQGLGKFYVDGVNTGSVTYPLPVSTTDSLYIGGTPDGDDFNGYIDEVRISKYEKTAEQIRSYMYRAVESNNDPNTSATDVVYNFDGYAHSNCDASLYGFMRGNAKFSNPNTINHTPVSPMIRYEYGNFPSGYRMKTTNKRLPETGTMGAVYDTIGVNSTTPITDINLFVATNHEFDGDLEMTLFAPNGDSVNICMDRALNSSRVGDIITTFDDNADSSLVSGRYTSFAPVIKPENSMSGVFGGDNPYGKWILRINDDALGDTGYVYSWGINLNNNTNVGVQTVGNTIPEKFELSQNYPNPFNPVTNIKFQVPQSGLVKLKVFDILGKEVAVLVNEVKQAGIYNADFNGAKLSSGVYFYRMESEGFTDTKKMLLVK